MNRTERKTNKKAKLFRYAVVIYFLSVGSFLIFSGEESYDSPSSYNSYEEEQEAYEEWEFNQRVLESVEVYVESGAYERDMRVKRNMSNY